MNLYVYHCLVLILVVLSMRNCYLTFFNAIYKNVLKTITYQLLLFLPLLMIVSLQGDVEELRVAICITLNLVVHLFNTYSYYILQPFNHIKHKLEKRFLYYYITK